MSKRLRKKQLKKLGVYVNPKETWNLDITISKWIVPRLKQLRDTTHSYPGRDEAATPEQWEEILNKMILAFELAGQDAMDLYNGGEDEPLNFEKYKDYVENYYNPHVQEGLQLFAKWYMDLWD